MVTEVFVDRFGITCSGLLEESDELSSCQISILGLVIGIKYSLDSGVAHLDVVTRAPTNEVYARFFGHNLQFFILVDIEHPLEDRFGLRVELTHMHNVLGHMLVGLSAVGNGKNLPVL